MKAKALPSQERLKELLHYAPRTGVFTWTEKLAPGRVKPGDVAGSHHNLGYIKITVDKSTFVASRLAWVWMTGEDPGDLDIDHIDHNPKNNSWINLQMITHAENIQRRMPWTIHPNSLRNLTFNHA